MARRQRLAIVGASVRAAAQSALRAGYDVVGADLFADADLDGVCPITKVDDYPDALADWLAEQDVDAWMYTGALENYPDLIDRMTEVAPLWGVSSEPLRRCRDPMVLQQVCAAAGVAFPETRRADELENPVTSGWLAKSYRHSSGAGTWRVENREDWEEAIDAEAYLQAGIEPGTSFGAAFLIGESSSACVGMTRQLLGAPDNEFACCGSVGPVSLAPYCEQLDKIGDCLAERLGLRGLIGIDLIDSDNRLFLIEVNPRYAASMEVIERATGRSVVEANAKAIEGYPAGDWQSLSGSVFAKRVVFAERDVVVTALLAEWLVGIEAADRPRVGEAIAAGRPVCTVFAEGRDEVDALESLDSAVRATESRLYD